MEAPKYTHEELAEMAMLYADALDTRDMFIARGATWERHAAEWQNAADRLAGELVGAGCTISPAGFVNWGSVK